jgi:ABC-type lipoprotein release transport system permease subunit
MRLALQKNLAVMALRDLLSKKVRLVLNLLGIVIGVSALLFLLSLTEGMRKTILRELVGSIPITELSARPAEEEKPLSAATQWVAKRVGVGRAKDVIIKEQLREDFTDKTLAEVRRIPGVGRVYGVKTLKRVPTTVEGWFFGHKEGDFEADAVVLGYAKELLVGDVEDLSDYVFRPEAVLDTYPFHTRFETEVLWHLLQARIAIAEADGCYVPAVLSRRLVRAYNMAFAAKPGFEMVKNVSEKSLIGEYMYVRFGESIEFLDPQEDVRAQGTLLKVVGLSDRVPMLGFAVPPEYLDVWEKAYFKEPPPSVYQQLIVQAKSVADVEPVRAELEKMQMAVESKKETIEKINSVTAFVRFAFVLIVAIILGITAVGILNVLTMSVYEERVDIGILRSVGARKGHVRFIYLLKAFVIGLIGSVAGLVLGWITMWGADALARNALHRMLYAPKSFFLVQWEFIVLSVAMGIGFAILAGISPSNHAARLNPSVVLRSA